MIDECFCWSQTLRRTRALKTGDSSAVLLQATDLKAEWVLQTRHQALFSGEYSPFLFVTFRKSLLNLLLTLNFFTTKAQTYYTIHLDLPIFTT
jgi:hypothetical protein